MKTLVISLTLGVASALVAATDDDEAAKDGGWYQIKGYGYVAAIDCRPVKVSDDYKAGVETVKSTFKPDIRLVEGRPFTLANAGAQLASSGANVAVFIVDDVNLPMTLTAYEEKWTFINAAKIRGDAPDKDRFRRRLSLLFMRQCYRILGSDATKTPDSCFYPVFSSKDLDDITSTDVPVGAYIAINESMSRTGIEGIEMGTYRDACEMGKASAPTNAIQKAIWEQVYTPPKNPMKIEFDPKKGK